MSASTIVLLYECPPHHFFAILSLNISSGFLTLDLQLNELSLSPLCYLDTAKFKTTLSILLLPSAASAACYQLTDFLHSLTPGACGGIQTLDLMVLS